MITVSSTTGTQADVEAAAKMHGESLVVEKPEDQSTGTSEAEEAETAAESETADDEESTGEEAEAEAQPEGQSKAKRKLLRQVSRLTGRNYKLQEELEQANTRLRQIESGGAKPPEPAAAVSTAKPDPKDPRFKTYEDYVEALADWKLEQKELAKARSAQEQHIREIFDDYKQQVEVAREKYDDFDETVNTDAQLPVIAINAMYELENGAEVAYYLAKHPDVRDQLLEWNAPNHRGGVRKILAKLDKISEQLGGNSDGTSSDETSAANGNGSSRPRQAARTAPAPIRPVGGGSSTRSTADPSKMSYQEYKSWWNKTHPGQRM